MTVHAFEARPVEDHLAEVERLLGPMVARIGAAAPDTVEVGDPGAAGRVCAAEVVSPIPLPPFDNSQMDGYAVRAVDLASASAETPIALPLGATAAAGDVPGVHASGTASPVMTGAAIPHGADAVVAVEATAWIAGSAGRAGGADERMSGFPPLSRAGERVAEVSVIFAAPAAPGAFVRRLGVDVAEGAPVARAGDRLTSARIGALAAAGIGTVPVRPRVRVLLCTTGDELAEAGRRHGDARSAELAPGSIHDANAPMLAALLRGAGAEVTAARVGDRSSELRDTIERAAPLVDLIVTSGGISMGAFEVVREALAPFGVVFGTVAMQPGGPQGLGSLRGITGADAGPIPVLCFPGNPVSSLLSAELFALPTLRALAGRPRERRSEPRPLAVSADSPEHKLQLRRARLEADGRVTPLPPGSHLIGDLADADVIAEIPVGVAHAPAGTIVNTWRIA